MSRLRNRLLVSHLGVAAAGAATSIAVVLWEAPAIFDRGLGPQGVHSQGQGGLRTVFQHALWQALALGSVAALVVALVATVVFSIRMLRPLEDVRRAARTISDGDYDLEIPLPRESELAALASDVNTMADRLRETEDRRVRLLGEVAHEMRTPLTVLTGRVEGIRDGVFAADRPLVDSMSDELHRLQRLADDLSTLSRVEEGRLDLDRKRIDLSGLAGRIVERYEGDPRVAGIDLGLTAGPSVWVEGDAQRLGQVVDNLVVNAIRAVSGRGRIEIEVTVVGGTATLTVVDDGCGIAADDVERIFERFYRESPPVRGRAQGSGSP